MAKNQSLKQKNVDIYTEKREMESVMKLSKTILNGTVFTFFPFTTCSLSKQNDVEHEENYEGLCYEERCIDWQAVGNLKL